MNNETNLHSCSFNPNEHLINVSYPGKAGEPERVEKYLEVKFRVYWFLVWCEENGKKGLIDDSNVLYIPEARTIMATCTVTVDGVLVGKSSAAVPFLPGDESGRYAVQTAETFAKGRALANAGFGTINSSSKNEEGALPNDTQVHGPTGTESPTPPLIPYEKQSAMDVPAYEPVALPDIPTYSEPEYEASLPAIPEESDIAQMPTIPPLPCEDERPTTPAATSQQAAPQGTKSKRLPTTSEEPDTASASMSLEEALAVTISVGQKKGMTLAALLDDDPSNVMFYAKNYGGRDATLKAAARVVWADYESRLK